MIKNKDLLPDGRTITVSVLVDVGAPTSAYLRRPDTGGVMQDGSRCFSWNCLGICCHDIYSHFLGGLKFNLHRNTF